MSRQLTVWVSAIFVLGLSALPAFAADDPALSKDLTSLIASQGLPCGRIVKINTQAERDYLVACQDGSNYQIVANAQGKLVAQPLGMKIH